jgi:hypothetical protein
MRNFLRALCKLRFRASHKAAQKAKAYHLGQAEARQCDKPIGKPKQYFPHKEWRLLAHIGCTGPTAKVDGMQDTELDEDILERIDFFACLFGARKV